MGLKSNDGCLSKIHTESDIREDSLIEEKQCEERGSDWNDVVTSQGNQGMPRTTGSWKSQGRILLWRLLRE